MADSDQFGRVENSKGMRMYVGLGACGGRMSRLKRRLLKETVWDQSDRKGHIGHKILFFSEQTPDGGMQEFIGKSVTASEDSLTAYLQTS